LATSTSPSGELERSFRLSLGKTVDQPERQLRTAFMAWGEVSVELIEIAGRQRQTAVHLGIGVTDLDEAIWRAQAARSEDRHRGAGYARRAPHDFP
jgi:hypothetical protein